MKRVLADFAYDGRAFRGILKDWRVPRLADSPDIHGSLTECLSQFNKRQPVIKLGELSDVRISSRTDVGVSAWQNSFTFDVLEPLDLELPKMQRGLN